MRGAAGRNSAMTVNALRTSDPLTMSGTFIAPQMEFGEQWQMIRPETRQDPHSRDVKMPRGENVIERVAKSWQPCRIGIVEAAAAPGV